MYFKIRLYDPAPQTIVYTTEEAVIVVQQKKQARSSLSLVYYWRTLWHVDKIVNK